MSILPRNSGREVVAAHIVLRQAVHPHRRIVVPDHAEVAKGTLRAIIKQTGLTVEEFKELL